MNMQKKLEQFALQILSEMLQELYLVHLFMKMENLQEHLIDMIMLTSLLLTLYLKIYKQKVLILSLLEKLKIFLLV